jgi:membrane protease subunit HflK
MPDRFPRDWPPGRPPHQDPLAALRELWERLGAGGGDGRRLPIGLVVLVAAVLYLASGIYIVAPDERGIVLRFGRVVRETGSGPSYHLPWPIETVLKPSVTAIRKDEIGFRTISAGPPARYEEVPREALMLTGDENIVKLEFIVQYRIRPDAEGPTDFLFNLRNPQEAVRAAAEAAMREVIGSMPIDAALTEGKERVQQDAQVVLQGILDLYDAGIEVVTLKLQDVDPPMQVSDAFKDVISAQQDRERLINEALGYANDVVPRARGQAAQLLNEAEAYRETRVRDATGVAQRFVALQEEYAKAPDVTRQRLYLEAMEAVLPDVHKILLDDLAAKQVVPYLPLEPFLRGRPVGEAAAGGQQ